VRQIGGLAAGIDDEQQMIAAIGDHQVVQNSAGRIRE
jgi:hypothetical protein